MDATTSLVKKFASAKKDLVESLASSDFYLELMLNFFSLALAVLVASLIQRFVTRKLSERPFQVLSTATVSKILALMAPLLAMLYLGIARPIIEEHYTDAGFTAAMIQLCAAWLIAGLLLLVIRSHMVAYFLGAVVFATMLLDVSGFLKPTLNYLDSLAFEIGKYRLSVLHVMKGLIIFVFVFWMAGSLSRSLETYLRRKSSLSYNSRELIVKFFTLFIYFLAFVITLNAMGVDLTALAVFGGALGVGVGLGLQKITANFVSGITLLIEKSIKLGDLIELGPHLGWVRQMYMRYTLLETLDGREVLIPNEELASSRVTNWTYSSDRARIDITISVSYDSDPRLARKLILDAARAHPRFLKDPEPTCHLREFGDSALVFLLSFWIPDVREGRFGPQSDVMFAILEKFKEHGIEIPYPQRVVRVVAPDLAPADTLQ